jgi:hypothetical protein
MAALQRLAVQSALSAAPRLALTAPDDLATVASTTACNAKGRVTPAFGYV